MGFTKIKGRNSDVKGAGGEIFTIKNYVMKKKLKFELKLLYANKVKRQIAWKPASFFRFSNFLNLDIDAGSRQGCHFGILGFDWLLVFWNI